MITKHASADLRKVLALAAGFTLASGLALAARADDAFIPAAINSSTIPANGDVNPYGVAFVPDGFPGRRQHRRRRRAGQQFQ